MLTSVIEHQYPTLYVSNTAEASIDYSHTMRILSTDKNTTAPLQKDLERDQSASFHYINAPVKITPPEGTLLSPSYDLN